jgi:urease accessory protein
MFAVSSQFERDAAHSKQPRVNGGIRVLFRKQGQRTCLFDCEERDGYKIRFPKGSQACEGVIINTGGGVAGGDVVAHEVTLGEAASVTLTTQASERIYRSNGSPTQIDVGLTLGCGASLAWLPQETILYEKSNITRCFEIGMASDASLLMVEIAVFGRKEMGETITNGRYVDRWRIRREGRVAFAENVRLEGDLNAALQRPAIGDGARVMGTIIHVSPDAMDKLVTVRNAISGATSRIAASAWNGLLCIRCLGQELEAMRQDISLAVFALQQQSMPKVWRN